MATALPPPQQLHTSAIAEVEPPLGTHELRVNAAYGELRTLHEAGEIDWSNLSPQAAYEFAYLDE